MRFKIATLASLMIASTGIYAASSDIGKLGISNHTTYSLSFAVNHACSSDIGNVTGYSIKTVSAAKIMKLCAESTMCDITGYDRPNCSGNAIGGAKIDFAKHKMEVISNNVDRIDVGGSIGLYEYNIFFNENYGPDDRAK